MFRRAVLFMEDTGQSDAKPLMLEAVANRPILSWMSRQLEAEGVRRFFVACGPRFAAGARSCLPEGAEAVISDLHSDLMAFLNTEETVAVFPRSALPMAEAGPGFAYAAGGGELRRIWSERMTNAVQGAELLSGWVPVYSRDAIRELEPLMRERAE